MKTVLFLSYAEYYPFKGGIAYLNRAWTENLKGRFNVVVAAPFLKNKDGSLEKEKIYRPRLTRSPILRSLIGNLFTLWLYLTKGPKYVVVSDQISLSLTSLLFLLKPLLKTKFYLILQGTEIADIKAGEGIIGEGKFRKMLGKFDLLLPISRFTKNVLSRNFPDLKTPQEILYPTVSEEFFKTKINREESALKKYGLEKDKYLLSVGRLVKRKGHHLVKVPPGLKYAVVGAGPEQDVLSRKNIVLIGEVDESTKKTLLKNCLFYIQPSIKSAEKHHQVEGFGISIIEAYAMGKTAIVFDHGGMPEIVKNGENGVVVEEGNVRKLTEAIKKLQIDNNLRKKLEKGAKQTFDNKFSKKIFREKLLKIFRPRLAYVVEWFYPVVGGAGKQALLQARHLKKLFDIKILTKKVKGAPYQGSTEGIPVTRFGKDDLSRGGDYLSGLELFKYLKINRKAFDFIHIHGNLENNFAFFATLFGKLFQKPVIGKLAVSGELDKHLESNHYSKTTIFVKNLNPLNWVRRFFAKRLNHFIAISSQIKEELEMFIDKKHISYIPNGVEIEESIKKRSEKDRVSFLVVSRLARHKGIIDPLLKVWKKYFKNNRDLVLRIAGSGEGLSSSIEEEVKNFVKTNRLRNVELVGKTNSLLPLYNQSDIFILPSENEGLSNALLEAASYGLVCIVSNVSGSTDVIQDKISGYVFEAGNSRDLYEKMKLALKEKSKWGKIGAKARGRVVDNYSIESVTNSLDRLYNRL